LYLKRVYPPRPEKKRQGKLLKRRKLFWRGWTPRGTSKGETSHYVKKANGGVGKLTMKHRKKSMILTTVPQWGLKKRSVLFKKKGAQVLSLAKSVPHESLHAALKETFHTLREIPMPYLRKGKEGWRTDEIFTFVKKREKRVTSGCFPSGEHRGPKGVTFCPLRPGPGRRIESKQPFPGREASRRGKRLRGPQGTRHLPALAACTR